MDINSKEILREMEKYNQQEEKLLESMLETYGFEKLDLQEQNYLNLEQKQEFQKIKETFPVKMPQASVPKDALAIKPAKNKSAKKRKSEAKQSVEKQFVAKEFVGGDIQSDFDMMQKMVEHEIRNQDIERQKEMQKISPMLKAAREKEAKYKEVEKLVGTVIKKDDQAIEDNVRIFFKECFSEEEIKDSLANALAGFYTEWLPQKGSNYWVEQYGMDKVESSDKFYTYMQLINELGQKRNQYSLMVKVAKSLENGENEIKNSVDKYKINEDTFQNVLEAVKRENLQEVLKEIAIDYEKKLQDLKGEENKIFAEFLQFKKESGFWPDKTWRRMTDESIKNVLDNGKHEVWFLQEEEGNVPQKTFMMYGQLYNEFKKNVFGATSGNIIKKEFSQNEFYNALGEYNKELAANEVFERIIRKDRTLPIWGNLSSSDEKLLIFEVNIKLEVSKKRLAEMEQRIKDMTYNHTTDKAKERWKTVSDDQLLNTGFNDVW